MIVYVVIEWGGDRNFPQINGIAGIFTTQAAADAEVERLEQWLSHIDHPLTWEVEEHEVR